ncbi:protein polyglycylase TTLL10 isoform X3 [Hydra vulgaris]|uniref:Protein polyglycylase TTLL10 isoform X3 n=1 Tax=Hydra vulgaris TaxID=6087 RepID=A0ABM4C453_HYDVU
MKSAKSDEEKKRNSIFENISAEKNVFAANLSSTKTKHLITVIEKERRFYVGGHNGKQILENALTKLGMKLTDDSNNFFIKWVECKKSINYDKFKEGYQIVNHIQNASCLTTKIGLLKTLRDYEKHQKLLRKRFSVNNFYMETYLVDSSHESQMFFQIFKKGELWICKPSSRNQGKGIFLVDDLSEFKKKIINEKLSSVFSKPCWIIQRYLMNPLLIHGCKFDVRVYMLIASVQPCLAFYHTGYARVTCVPYTNENLDLNVHLTNQYVQKKNLLYKEMKEQTVLSFDQLNKYINENVKESKQLPNDWVLSGFQDSMKVIMVDCLKASLDKLDKKKGCFDLLGFDFIIDENMKVWLIEINTNPALHTNCSVLNNLLPPMIDEVLSIVIELFNTNLVGELKSLLNFQPIFNSSTRYQFQTK